MRDFKEPREAGIEPESWFELRTNEVREERLDNEGGIGPEREFELKSRIVRPVQADKSAGTEPVRLASEMISEERKGREAQREEGRGSARCTDWMVMAVTEPVALHETWLQLHGEGEDGSQSGMGGLEPGTEVALSHENRNVTCGSVEVEEAREKRRERERRKEKERNLSLGIIKETQKTQTGGFASNPNYQGLASSWGFSPLVFLHWVSLLLRFSLLLVSFSLSISLLLSLLNP